MVWVILWPKHICCLQTAYLDVVYQLAEFASVMEVDEPLNVIKNKVRSFSRKVVTGSEEKSLRDHLKRELKKPMRVKLKDKISFTLGLLNVMATEYFLLRKYNETRHSLARTATIPCRYAEILCVLVSWLGVSFDWPQVRCGSRRLLRLCQHADDSSADG